MSYSARETVFLDAGGKVIKKNSPPVPFLPVEKTKRQQAIEKIQKKYAKSSIEPGARYKRPWEREIVSVYSPGDEKEIQHAAVPDDQLISSSEPVPVKISEVKSRRYPKCADCKFCSATLIASDLNTDPVEETIVGYMCKHPKMIPSTLISSVKIDKMLNYCDWHATYPKEKRFGDDLAADKLVQEVRFLRRYNEEPGKQCERGGPGLLSECFEKNSGEKDALI